MSENNDICPLCGAREIEREDAETAIRNPFPRETAKPPREIVRTSIPPS